MGLAEVRGAARGGGRARARGGAGRRRGEVRCAWASRRCDELERQGAVLGRLEKRAHLKYEGTDTALVVPLGSIDADARRVRAPLRAALQLPHAASARWWSRRSRWRRSGVAPRRARRGPPRRQRRDAPAPSIAKPVDRVEMVSGGARHDTQCVRARGAGARRAHRRPRDHRRAQRHHRGRARLGGARDGARSTWCSSASSRARCATPWAPAPIPVMLEVFNNLFMSIAEQMGVRLAQTAYSVNIKERLDFSCALFDADGNLIANAPHMPVHLGSMGESIKTVIARERRPDEARRRVRAERPVQRRHAPAGRDGDHAGVLEGNGSGRPGSRRRHGSSPLLVLRRLARPPRRHRRHHPRLHAALLEERGRGRRAHRQREAGRGRPHARGRHARAARGGALSGAQSRPEHRRPARPGGGQREGRAGAEAHGRALRPGRRAAPTCATCRTTPRSACAA